MGKMRAMFASHIYTTREHLLTTKEQADKALVAAQLQEEAAQKLAKSFEGRDKELRNKEDLVKQMQLKYENLVNEYNEKLAKLRSVMG